MQPIRPGLAGSGPLHQQLCSRNYEVPHQLNTSPQGSEKAHSIRTSLQHGQQAFLPQSILSEVKQSATKLFGTGHCLDAIHHNWVYRRVALPVFALLRMGASPQKLAWSIAIGLLIGINPVIGSTTVLCLAVAFFFRLNVAASPLGNHVVYPLQLLLVVPFIRLGSRVFHTAPMPLSAKALLDAARTSPIALTRQLWLWEWHAFVVWAAIAFVAIPVFALALTPLLQRLLVRVERHQYPIISAD